MKLISKILLISIIISLYAVISPNVSKYREQFDIDSWQGVYNTSQYCVPECIFDGNIDDPPLYQLAGYRYITGADPSSINFELQPLTKYLFGISILLFGNGVWIQTLGGILLLYLTFLISKEIFRRPHLAYIPPLLLSFDLLFREQLTTTYLDMYQALFIQLFIYILYLWTQKRANIRVVMIVLGLSALSKSFAIGVLVFLTGIIYLHITTKKQQLIEYLRASFWSVLTYILGYFVFFMHHFNPLDFLSLHVRILRFYRSYVPEYPKGEIFRILILGKWRKWYDDFGLRTVKQWDILWPIALAASTYVALKLRKQNKFITLNLLWVGVYLLAASFKLVFPRYLMPVLPSMYILLTYGASNWYCKYCLNKN